MPDGIVPELVLVAALLVLTAVVVAFTRRPRPPASRRPGEVVRDESDAVLEAPAEDAERAAAAPGRAEPEDARRGGAALRDRLAKSRRHLADRLASALGGGPGDEAWDDVEAALIQGDVGVETSAAIVERVKAGARERRIGSADEVRSLLAQEMVALFDETAERGLAFSSEGLTVWVVVGVNGTGKTTTIGKLANDLRLHGRRVSLAAADTFRAAADEQLGVWARRAGADVTKHQPGADPGAVAFDAVQHARAAGIDVLIVDTAGRLHTKTPLMDELAKIRRVIEKQQAVQETLLVIDATAGQNGLVQAREFARAAGVSGIVLTKLDGTAKGGIAVAIERTLGLPIKLIGVGESIEDLEPFEPKTFVDALLA